MDPPSKRRRLAPKVPDPPPPPTLPSQYPPEQVSLFTSATITLAPSSLSQAQPAAQHYPDAVPPAPERQDFERFARHLQDAAMYIYRQTQKSHYSGVSVLLLRWEDDSSVDHDVSEVESVLRDRYHFHTRRWAIPGVRNASLKLGMEMASFLQHDRPDQLFIIYYTGCGYVGTDRQLYWAR